MSFGISVKNDEENVQIDADYSVFRAISEGHSPKGQEHPIPTENQILLVRPGGGIGIIGSTWINEQWFVSSNVGVDWALLQVTKASPPSPDPFGMRVWDDSEALVYDSGTKGLHPRVNGVFDGNMATSRAVVSPGTPQHGRKRYIEWSFMRRNYGIAYDFGSGLPYGSAVVATAEFTANQVSVGLSLGGSTAPVNAPPTRAIIKFMVADV